MFTSNRELKFIENSQKPREQDPDSIQFHPTRQYLDNFMGPPQPKGQ